jgi:hypothetical protein
MVMLMISAPVFIQDPIARHFLEAAQNLGGELTRSLALTHKSPGGATPRDRLDDALDQLQTAAAPLLALLSPDVRDSIQRIAGAPDR